MHLKELLESRDWQPWELALPELCDSLGVDPSQGLETAEAQQRLEQLGANVPLDLSQQLGLFRVFLGELSEPMVLLLLTVGILYSIWGEPWDAFTIFVAITLVISLEVLTEWRAKRAILSLRNSVPANTTVLRDGGTECIVPADQVVVGDILYLINGQTVPADAIIVAGHGVSVDESMMTGESDNVYKRGINQNGQRTLETIPQTMVCAGCTVTSGRAVAMVVATGKHTYVSANIGGLVRDTARPPPTPLQLRMGRLARVLSIVAILVCILMTLIGLLKGMHWRTAILMGMSLAFATIPEELPLIAKASLALGARTLARHKLLVRRLGAADALSSVSVVITDKTGTLTKNQLIVSSLLTVSGEGSVEIVTPEAVNQTSRSANLVIPLYASWSISVDPLESRPLMQVLDSTDESVAGVRGFGKDHLNSAVLESVPTKDTLMIDSISTVIQSLTEPTGEMSFDPSLRVSACTRSSSLGGHKHWTVLKGAPETILPLCGRIWSGSSQPLTQEDILKGELSGFSPMTELVSQSIARHSTRLAVSGNRIMAYAVAITQEPLYREALISYTNLPATLSESQQGVLPKDLIFAGAFAFYDPPLPEARAVVKECQDSGIRVIMATGDHPSTALAVASSVGIAAANAVGIPATSEDDDDEDADEQQYLLSSSSQQITLTESYAVTGDMLQRSLSNNQEGTLDRLISEGNVFARVTPAQKLRLVHALQAQGEVVAFIGDGINDAPALTRADVGICMGGNPSAADVAMDAAGLVILSSSFQGVIRCLREGWRLRANIDKCVGFYLSYKLALVMLFAFLLVAEGASPLTPVQVIVIELFADLGALWTLLTEKAEGLDGTSLVALGQVDRAMGEETRGRSEPGFLGGSNKQADIRVLVIALTLFLICILPLLVPSLLLPSWAVAPVAPTLTFLTWMLAHALLGISMRTRLLPLRIHGQRNQFGRVWVGCSVCAVVGAAFVPAVAGHLGIVRLNVVEWVMVLVAPLLLFGVLEAVKEVRYKRIY